MTNRLPISALALLMLAAAGGEPARAASVMVNIPEAYATVQAGERVYFQIEFLYPENVRRRDFRIAYEVRQGDEVLASAEFLKAVETQASFTDYAVVPATASRGLHTIQVRITDDTGAVVIDNASASFQVTGGYGWAAFHFYTLLAAILSVGFVLLLEIRRLPRAIARARA